MSSFDILLLIFGLLFLGYSIFAISAGRLHIKRPRKWNDLRKEFTREKTAFAYYFVVFVMFIIAIIMIGFALL